MSGSLWKVTSPVLKVLGAQRLLKATATRPPRSRRRASKLLKPLALIGAGSAGAYLLDPDRGRARRARLGQQIAAGARRRRRRLGDRARHAEGQLAGAAATAAGAGRFTPADDRAVADKIQEALAASDFDTTKVTVEVVDGVATLRGQVARPEHIRELEGSCGSVAGVRRLESFLHLPHTDAPNKAPSLAADASARGSVVNHG